MSKRSFDLARVFDPVDRETFFNMHWERKPLHLSRDDRAYYDSLLTIADLERMVASPEGRYPAVQLSKGGAYLPPEVFTEDLKFGTDTFTGVTNLQRVLSEYRAGATVVLPALHRTWAPLGDLCARIDSELDHVAHANAYLTPGNTAGFTPHYDTHEVLVLQIAGKKRWRVYEPPIQLPHRRQPFTPRGYLLPEQPLLEIDLSPGDLLYLPRGHVHTTTTSDGASAHITIGIAVYTWLDLAGELLQSAMASPRFREALPPGFARADLKSDLKAEFASVLDDLHKTAETGELLDAFLGRLGSNKASERGTFRWDVTVIQPETMLEAPDPREYRIVGQGAKVVVEFQERRFILPANLQPLLEEIRGSRCFRTGDLLDSLDIDTKMALVRTLFEKGFVTVSPQN